MSIEPSSLTAKLAKFLTSLGSQTSHEVPTTFALASFFLRELASVAIPSSKFSSSSLIVISTDFSLRKKM
ncbi:hypothetical protein HanRHA438_Chr10g0478261 [Helianthus annuus]|nr:hypothetical protein HanRHA438_Chr10g0478261 [Helianthus annuus]